MWFYINYPSGTSPDEWDWLELGWRAMRQREITGLDVLDEYGPESWGSEAHANYKIKIGPEDPEYSECLAVKTAIELGCRDAAATLYRDLLEKIA